MSSHIRGPAQRDAGFLRTRRAIRRRHRDLRRDIEGLRAVAVLMVLTFHLGAPGSGGGFAGVDVFFVISGFLITGLLYREWLRHGRIDLLSFYARRARRLLPVAILVIIVTFLWGWWVLPASEYTRLAHDSLGATWYVVNWVLAARSVDYLAEDAAPSPLQHYWSLSVEEQFYLLWPVIMVLGLGMVLRIRSGRRASLAVPILAALTLASLAWSIHLTQARPLAAYFVTTTRLWELGLGALLVFALPIVKRLRPASREILAAGGLAAILVTHVSFGSHSAWPGYLALVPVLGTAALLAAGSSDDRSTATGRLLATRPLVWIGGLSYAIYLWHWPLIMLTEAQYGQLGPGTRLLLGTLAILLAWLTKMLVEDPVRFHRLLAMPPGRTLAWGFGVMILTTCLVLAALTIQPSTHERLNYAAPTLSSLEKPDPAGSTTEAPQRVRIGPGALVDDVGAARWTLRENPEKAFTRSGVLSPPADIAPLDVPTYYDDDCQIAQGEPAPRHDCVYGAVNGTQEVLLVGDSKAGQWFSALDAIARNEGWTLRLYLKSACPFTTAGSGTQDCDAFGQSVLNHLVRQTNPPDIVLFSAGAEATPELTDGVENALGELVDQGTRVILLADTPYPPGSRYPCALENPNHLEYCSFDRRIAGGTVLLRDVGERLELPTIDLNQWICPPGSRCPVAIGERLMWRQGSHLTDTYVRDLTPFLYRELSALGLTHRGTHDIPIDDVPLRHGGAP